MKTFIEYLEELKDALGFGEINLEFNLSLNITKNGYSLWVTEGSFKLFRVWVRQNETGAEMDTQANTVQEAKDIIERYLE